ncbi:MAG: cytochrome-c oxidase, cbb3-type subunit I [Phycisphaeraceae bacterium]|nr:cytochrome-c oxidase, cbb3-type subunit I [Phycisphaeraceae bacterium]
MSTHTSTAPESFVYDDAIVRKFTAATVLWGVVGMLVGLIIAIQLALPATVDLPAGSLLLLDREWFSFGRLRPLHTNAVIFAFAGNAIFAAVYYSTQRLCKARMFSDLLSNVHFWGWQLIIVAAAITLPLGITQSKEYAELEWPIDIAIALVWIVFAINFFGTLLRRRERHLYVALWFYIATIVAITVLHVFNNLSVPSSVTNSYSIYAGVQDAFMQWWYGHNAVAFFLTTPFLGLMYYFLPKAAERPVFSYRLSIVHFWSLVFIYIWAGPHHLHYTSLPAWASTLGMLFSLMLWMPSWGGMINGLLTLRGAWHRVAADPILKFYVVAITFYGMSTFEGPMLSIKSVNALSHYTDWTIAHVHGGALGWVGFMVFGMIYWLAPRIFQTSLWSPKLMATHFWTGTIGILLYIIPIYFAGVTQGLMWLAFDDKGMLAFPEFIETVTRLMPYYWARVIGGTIYLSGTIMLAVNLIMTWRARPARYEEPVHTAPALARDYPAEPPTPSRLAGAPVTKSAHLIDRFAQMNWHRTWERLPVRFTVWTIIAVVVASLFEIIPTFVIRSNVPTIATVMPYTPLELAGRDIYISEGCNQCHSQMIRPIHAETERYGDFSLGGEFVYDHPFLWGSRRIGPDLQRVGGRFSHLWHVRHLVEPRSLVRGSLMPNYPHLLDRPLDFDGIAAKVRAMSRLGVPYTPEELEWAPDLAREQAARIMQEVVDQDGPDALPPAFETSRMIALVAYLQRLGTDRYRSPEDAASSATALVRNADGAATREVTDDRP